jgi:hypothetical protein
LDSLPSARPSDCSTTPAQGQGSGFCARWHCVSVVELVSGECGTGGVGAAGAVYFGPSDCRLTTRVGASSPSAIRLPPFLKLQCSAA